MQYIIGLVGPCAPMGSGGAPSTGHMKVGLGHYVTCTQSSKNLWQWQTRTGKRAPSWAEAEAQQPCARAGLRSPAEPGPPETSLTRPGSKTANYAELCRPSVTICVSAETMQQISRPQSSAEHAGELSLFRQASRAQLELRASRSLRRVCCPSPYSTVGPQQAPHSSATAGRSIMSISPTASDGDRRRPRPSRRDGPSSSGPTA